MLDLPSAIELTFVWVDVDKWVFEKEEIFYIGWHG